MKGNTPGIKLFLTATLVFCGTSCSFHSNQYEFLQSLVARGESGPTKNWMVEFNGVQTPVYAINGLNYLLFADEFGLQIRYQDSQLTYAKGLLRDELFISADRENNAVALTYATLAQRFGETDSCSSWAESLGEESQDSALTLWVQQCAYEELTYKNSVQTNSSGQVISLEFMVTPRFPSVRIFYL